VDFANLAATLRPAFRNVTLSAGFNLLDFTIFKLNFSQGISLPQGNYTWIGALTESGTLNFLGDINSATFNSWALSIQYLPMAFGPYWMYAFSIYNDLGEDIWEFYLDLPITVGELSPFFYSPSGWGDGFGSSTPFYGAITATTSFVDWRAEFGSELASGNSLSGFSFTVPYYITAPINFSVSSASGITRGTATLVPEPATLY
jgi:hypothetical protein